MFFGAILMMYALGLSLESPEGFAEAQEMLSEGFFARLIAWGMVSALLYHLLAGVKHLIMDFGHLEELESGRMAAKATLIAGGVAVLLAGVWVW